MDFWFSHWGRGQTEIRRSLFISNYRISNFTFSKCIFVHHPIIAIMLHIFFYSVFAKDSSPGETKKFSRLDIDGAQSACIDLAQASLFIYLIIFSRRSERISWPTHCEHGWTSNTDINRTKTHGNIISHERKQEKHQGETNTHTHTRTCAHGSMRSLLLYSGLQLGVY